MFIKILILHRLDVEEANIKEHVAQEASQIEAKEVETEACDGLSPIVVNDLRIETAHIVEPRQQQRRREKVREREERRRGEYRVGVDLIDHAVK